MALHGAAHGTRAHPLYRHLHALLPPLGVGVLTFDRRGEGASTGEPSRGRLDVQADDALALAAALPARTVGLWGWSQGAWAAPLAASRSRRIAFLVLLASTGVSPAAQMRYATAEQVRRAGFDEGAVAAALALRARLEAWVDGDAAPGLAGDLARAAATAPWWQHAWLPDGLPPDGPGADALRAEARAELRFEPEPVFAATRVPTLLVYGDDDGWSPVPESIAAWRRARADGVELHVLPGTGHEPRRGDGAIDPAYARLLAAWVPARG